jgi:hypothetical protein
MSTDIDPDIMPVYGPPPSVEEQARGQAAQDRPHPHAPIVESHHLDKLDDSLHTAFSQARDLFRIRAGRNPADDVRYAHLRPHLITLAGQWSRALQDDPLDDELADLLSELRGYLPLHERGSIEAASEGIVMRSRMEVVSVTPFAGGADVIGFRAIGPGEEFTDSRVDLSMMVVNHSLIGRFQEGQTFDVLFTQLPPPPETLSHGTPR